MKKRIIGIDIARALAIIGMVIVNFKTVLGAEGHPLLKTITSFFDGKAAATFVVLAGVGISLMAKSALEQQDAPKLLHIKKGLFKRAIFLWIFGLAFYFIWPPDILHFYAIYILITALLLNASNRLLWTCIIVLMLGYPFSLGIVDYEAGWDFESLEYLDFFSLNGFFRNLFINGFHPVWPWAGFMVFGIWFGRFDLSDHSILKKALLWSTIIFIVVHLLSWLSIELLAQDPTLNREELGQILGTAPMPPFPFYMISGSSIAIIVICLCIFASQILEDSKVITMLAHTGQLALTFYVAHVIFGIGLVQAFYPKELGTYSLEFSIIAALLFSLCCLIFATVWRHKFQAGPLEWALRKLTS